MFFATVVAADYESIDAIEAIEAIDGAERLFSLVFVYILSYKF